MIGAAEVEAYLRRHIPLVRHMDVRVAACDVRGVRLAAPLAANVNHVGTVFAGSASSLAMLSGWALLHARLADEPAGTSVVIRRGSIDYDQPIDDDVEAWCPAPSAATWQRFQADLRGHGKGRIELAAVLERRGEAVASFAGVYVALRS